MSKPKLSVYELAILNAVPCSDSDKAKVDWGEKPVAVVPKTSEEFYGE